MREHAKAECQLEDPKRQYSTLNLNMWPQLPKLFGSSADFDATSLRSRWNKMKRDMTDRGRFVVQARHSAHGNNTLSSHPTFRVSGDLIRPAAYGLEVRGTVAAQGNAHRNL
jgi:hypothetical protein